MGNLLKKLKSAVSKGYGASRSGVSAEASELLESMRELEKIGGDVSGKIKKEAEKIGSSVLEQAVKYHNDIIREEYRAGKKRVSTMDDTLPEWIKKNEEGFSKNFENLKRFNTLSAAEEAEYYESAAERYKYYSTQLLNNSYLSDSTRLDLSREYYTKAQDMEYKAYQVHEDILKAYYNKVIENYSLLKEEHQNACAELEQIQKQTDRLAEKMSETGGYAVSIKKGSFERTILPDNSYKVELLEKRNELTEALKERFDELNADERVRQQILDSIYSQGNYEAVQTLLAFAAKSDEGLKEFIENERKANELARNGAEAAFAEEFAAAGEGISKIAEKLAAAGYEIPEDFGKIGLMSADAFSEEYLKQIKAAFENAGEFIQENAEKLILSTAMERGTQISNANYYNSYEITAAGSSPSEYISAIERQKMKERLLGIGEG